MEKVQHQSDQHVAYCQNQNDINERLSAYLRLDSHRDDPLRQPEITVNLNERSALIPLHTVEEPEEDIFNDYEAEVSTQDGNTDSEEQVVPSSQLSSGYKYPEDYTISDDEIDEGIFEEDFTSYDSAQTDDNHRHDPQPP